MGIDPAGWTLLVVVGVMVGLAVLKTSPDLVLLGGLVLLVVLGVFPDTSLEVTRPTRQDFLGFLVCFAICFVIIGLVLLMAGIGA